ncbi:hypothetical protein SSX86_025910 [Deinandra increscens subsp. villosa]|uniref:Glycolipid transfer protein domain-containing protein n=1 Tax=Deinandra increscens subsp. villosa TaxID=3103831 RepID=A0AAP0CF29_9ASTR
MDSGDRPLRKISEAFNEIANSINSHHQNPNPNQQLDLELASFSRACSLVSALFGCLGIAFKFAEMDYVAKVNDLCEASKSILTLQSMIEKDIEQNCVRKPGSHTRNLLKVKRGLDMIRVLFEQILLSDENSLKNPASMAYEQVLSPYHGWAVQKAVGAGMYTLPSKQKLVQKLNEDEASVRREMQNYVSASAFVIVHIDKLFQSLELGIDW